MTRDSDSDAGGRTDTFNGGGALEQLVARIAQAEARRAVREALRDLPGSAPRFTTLAAYARRERIGGATLRRWARAAGVQRQANGKYLTAELDQVVASGGKPLAMPTPPPPEQPLDFAAARARRVAADLTRGRR